MSKLFPATYREGRISARIRPLPYDDEPLEVWKTYLKEIRESADPTYVLGIINNAKKILATRGKEVMKELEPLFEFHKPMNVPKFNDSIGKWGRYIKYTGSNKVDLKESNGMYDFMFILEGLMSKIGKEELIKTPKYQQIRKLMDAQIPAELKERWECLADKALNGKLNHV